MERLSVRWYEPFFKLWSDKGNQTTNITITNPQNTDNFRYVSVPKKFRLINYYLQLLIYSSIFRHGKT